MRTRLPGAIALGSRALALGAALLHSAAALAGVNVWSASGPPGRIVHAVATDPSNPLTVYAGTEEGGVYRTLDGGKSWRQANLSGKVVGVLAVSPAPASVVYAGLYADGVFRSRDGGTTWSRSGLEGLTIVALAVSPGSPSTVYASYYASPFGDDRGGLARSEDSGASWTPILETTGFGGPVAIDPSAPSTIYTVLTTQFGGAVYKTVDGGAHWTGVFAGAATTRSRPGSLAIDPSAPSTLYASAETFLLPARPEKPADDLGIYRSTDAGAHWTQVHDSSIGGGFLVHPTNHTLYVLNFSKIWRSSNQGVTFTQSFVGLPAAPVQSLAFGPAASGTFYSALGAGGVFKSTDSGDRWSPINHGLTASEVDAVAVDPGTPGRLYAGSTGFGVFEGLAGGGWWHDRTHGIDDLEILSIALDRTDLSRAFVGTHSGIYRTTAGGLFWTFLHSGTVAAIAMDPSTPDTIYAGQLDFSFPGGLWKSVDGGDHWTQLPIPGFDTTVRALAVDPASPATVYAGGQTMVKSLDGGSTWGASGTGLDGTVFALAIDPTTPSTLYAGTDRGVFKSTNGGGGWSPINSGIGDTTTVFALAIDPTAPETVYAGTSGEGVLRTIDGGASWSPINEGLTGLIVKALAIDGTGVSLFAGTESNGAFSYRNASVPSVARIAPSSGPASGGTAVTISGSGFRAGDTVRIGGVAAADVVVVDDSTITAKTPPLPAGALYPVLVSNSGSPATALSDGWLSDFGDVPADFLFHDAVEKLFRAAVTRGCGGGDFCPNDPLTWAQVATFSVRTVRGPAYRPPAATGDVYADVSTSTFLADWIEAAYAQSLAGACSFGTPLHFCPEDHVSRGDYTQSLWFAEHGVTFPGGVGGVFFKDVPVTLPNAGYIEALTKEGIIGGCGGGNFCPSALLTRAEAAAFLARVFSLP